jgi:protein O-GlcNAc transferase
MGFCGSMGAEYIDYIIADRTVIPPELIGFYSEKIICLPHSYFVNDHKQSSSDLIDLSFKIARYKYDLRIRNS